MSGNTQPGEQPDTWELLNDELRHRIDIQRSAFERLEARAGIVAAVAFGALQFVAREPVESGWLPAAVVAYVLAMVCASALAVLPRRFHEPKPASILVGLWLYPRGRAAAELANNRKVAFEKNVGRQARAVLLLRVSVGLLALGAILSTVHLTQGEPPPMSDETPQDTAPPVPQAPAPPPDDPPQPGVPTMNLLDTDTRAFTGAEFERTIVRGGEPRRDDSGRSKR
jgi:hypothetical protein